jgi:hypothetical protein
LIETTGSSAASLVGSEAGALAGFAEHPLTARTSTVKAAARRDQRTADANRCVGTPGR